MTNDEVRAYANKIKSLRAVSEEKRKYFHEVSFRGGQLWYNEFKIYKTAQGFILNKSGDKCMSEELKVLSRRVKLVRVAKGISQTNMANAIGVSQTNLSNMESGRTAITTQNLFKIQKVLGCKMADFFVDFDGEEPKKEENLEGKAIELEDDLTLLKLLKSMNIKGLKCVS